MTDGYELGEGGALTMLMDKARMQGAKVLGKISNDLVELDRVKLSELPDLDEGRRRCGELGSALATVCEILAQLDKDQVDRVL
jgi:hypothetical protein